MGTEGKSRETSLEEIYAAMELSSIAVDRSD